MLNTEKKAVQSATFFIQYISNTAEKTGKRSNKAKSFKLVRILLIWICILVLSWNIRYL